MHILRKANTFRSLTGRQRRLFFQAYGLLGAMRFALMTRPFKSLVEDLELHKEAFDQPLIASADLASAKSVGWAVRKAAQYTPWKSTCLVQVLAAQKMLQRREIPGVFYLGAATDAGEGSGVDLSAHAWLKCGDAVITGEPGHQRFTIVSGFSWT